MKRLLFMLFFTMSVLALTAQEAVTISGNVTDEAWKEYIKNQKPPEPDDDFDVV